MAIRLAKRAILAFACLSLVLAWADRAHASEFQPGQTVTVATESTNLMHGERVLRALPRGHSATVQKVQEHWILVRADGQLGWVSPGHLVLAKHQKRVPQPAVANEILAATESPMGAFFCHFKNKVDCLG